MVFLVRAFLLGNLT